MQVIVDGMLTHYERSGSGPVLLVLPGWADTSRSWQGISRRLQENYEVIVLDIPGFGGTQIPSQAWSLHDYAVFVGRFLQKLDIPELFGVIGHSNGGAMAIKALAIKQISAKKLILVASAGIRGQNSKQKTLLKMVAKTGKIVSAPLSGSVKKRLRAKLYSAAGSDLLVAEHMQETFKLVVGEDIQKDAAKLDLPTLLIYGDKDRETPVLYGKMFHTLIAGSLLEIIEGAGHFVHVDSENTIVDEIIRFFKW